MSPTNQDALEVRTATVGSGDDRWSRWVATGQAHERAAHRRAVTFAVIVGASLALWGTLAIVVR